MRTFVFLKACALVFLAGCGPGPSETAEQAAASQEGKTRKIQTKMTPQQVVALLERQQETAPFVPGEVIVKLKENVPVAATKATASKLNLAVKREATSGGEIVYTLPPKLMGTMSEGEQRDRTLAAVKALNARPDVEYAQPNFLLRIEATPSDPFYDAQWHYFANGSAAGQSPGGVSLPDTWNVNTGGTPIKVAVIDTGILPNHPDVAGSANLASGFDMISDPAIANDGDGRDDDPTDTGDGVQADECGPGEPAEPSSWHGSHVAGTVGVVRTNNSIGVAGVNWNTQVQALRVLGKCGGAMDDINDAIRWAAGLPVPGVAQTNSPRANVINMSLGAPAPCSASPATQAAIDDVIAAGVTVVVAAGNANRNAATHLPASCNGVITVAASDLRGHIARYSNFGPRIDIMAPGGDVLRNDNGDGNPDGVLSIVDGGYEFYNGTSMAAPHVAGVAALILANDPTKTPVQILAELQSAALPRNATQCPPAKPCGAGLLSAVGIKPGAQPPVPPPPVTVTLDPNSLTITQGKTGSVTATITIGGAAAANQTVTFSSSDSAIAKLASASAVTNSAGEATVNVEGAAPGTAQVTAASDGGKDSANVTVAARSSAIPFAFVLLVLTLVLVALRLRAVPAKGA